MGDHGLLRALPSTRTHTHVIHHVSTVHTINTINEIKKSTWPTRGEHFVGIFSIQFDTSFGPKTLLGFGFILSSVSTLYFCIGNVSGWLRSSIFIAVFSHTPSQLLLIFQL